MGTRNHLNGKKPIGAHAGSDGVHGGLNVGEVPRECEPPFAPDAKGQTHLQDADGDGFEGGVGGEDRRCYRGGLDDGDRAG